MKKFIVVAVCVLLAACTVYTEKQSKALSQVVYATKDSLDKARIDLAVEYSAETTRLVKPPKPQDRIKIDSVYKSSMTIPVIASSPAPSEKTPLKPNRQRVIIVPEIYKNDTVVVVNSEEYQQLLKDKEIHEQLKKNYAELANTKTEVDEELAKQQKYANEMVIALNTMQKKLAEKDAAIWKRNLIILCLVLSIGGGIYLRMKGIL